mgnify:FL=1
MIKKWKQFVNESNSDYSLLNFFQEMQSFPAAGGDKQDIEEASKPVNKMKTVSNVPELQGLLDDWSGGKYDEDPGYLVNELRGLLESNKIDENLSAELDKETILHILNLKVKEGLNKKVNYELWDFDDAYKGVSDGGTVNAYKSGRKKAFKEVLDMINDFDKNK